MKIKKIVIILFISMLFMGATTPIYAHTVGEIITEGKDFIDEGTSSGKPTINTDKLHEASNVVYNIVFSIGVVVSVAVAAILGIRYMIGSLEQKAQIKETIIPFLVGCFIVFGAFGIWKVVILLSAKFV